MTRVVKLASPSFFYGSRPCCGTRDSRNLPKKEGSFQVLVFVFISPFQGFDWLNFDFSSTFKIEFSPDSVKKKWIGCMTDLRESNWYTYIDVTKNRHRANVYIYVVKQWERKHRLGKRKGERQRNKRGQARKHWKLRTDGGQSKFYLLMCHERKLFLKPKKSKPLQGVHARFRDSR